MNAVEIRSPQIACDLNVSFTNNIIIIKCKSNLKAKFSISTGEKVVRK